MFETPIEGMDPDATLSFAAHAQARVHAAEVEVLQAAARWADLHAVSDGPVDAAGVVLRGCERLIQLGGDGTPGVAEFAPAELAAVLGMSAFSGAKLVGQALDLRHRLPQLWARVQAGEVPPYLARRIADTSHHLSFAAAALVDEQVTPIAHTLTWARLERICQAAVLKADPDQAARDTDAAERSTGVWVDRSSDHGTRDIFIRTDAASGIWFEASLNRVADSLSLLGDTRSHDQRRAAAVGVLAHPQRALDLFHEAQAIAHAAGVSPEEPPDDEQADPAGNSTEVAKRVRRVRRVDSRPPATLYIHLDAETFTRDAAGVARFEGVGPITTDQATRFLSHCHVTVKPVIDLAHQAPVDAYEVPDSMREAVQLRSLADVFPYASNTSRTMDMDHTIPYLDPDEGGPPGQTNTGNLGPMTRFHHRIKTHAGWQSEQPFDGIAVWRSPHGRYYLVDHTGTTPLHKPPTDADSPPEVIPAAEHGRLDECRRRTLPSPPYRGGSWKHGRLTGRSRRPLTWWWGSRHSAWIRRSSPITVRGSLRSNSGTSSVS